MLLRRLARSLALTAALGLGLAACSSDSPTPPDDSATATPTESAPVEPTQAADPDSAEGRQIAFDAALADSWSEDRPVDRQRTIDALVAAGFDTEQMEATDEFDSLQARVANMEVAVLIGDTCIVGQTGDAGTRSILAPPLPTGVCLVGDTPPID